MRPDIMQAKCAAIAAFMAIWTLAGAGVSSWRQLGGGAGVGGALHFADAGDGWLISNIQQAGPDETLVGYRTRDGGDTWDELHILGFRESLTGRYSWVTGRGPFCAFRIGVAEAWVGGAEAVAHTVDGGATWDITHLWPALVFTRYPIGLADRGALNVRGLHFHDSMSGMALVAAESAKDGDTAGIAVLATDDGGRAWAQWGTRAPDSPFPFLATRLRMASSTVGWMTHWRTGLLVTTDAGATWRGTDYGVRRAHVAANGDVWATTEESAGDKRVYLAHSPDLGLTWEPARLVADLPEEFASHGALSSLKFAPDGRGWAVGAFGVVLATVDGDTWTREQTPTDSRLLDVQYVDGVVYASGEGGGVLKRDAASAAIDAVGKRPTTWAPTKAGGGRDGSR